MQTDATLPHGTSPGTGPAPMDESFDVVVIGSGIGGLSAARMLAEFGGKRVLVLEQHYTLGGLTHEFTREGRYHFGTGVHYLTGGPSAALRFLADGRAQFHRLPHDYDILHFPGFDFAVPASEPEMKARLKARFPQEARAIDRFFAAVRWASLGSVARHVVSSLAPAIRAAALPVIELLFRDTFRPTRNVVARYFKDPELSAIVSARWGLFGPPPARSAFGTHAVIAIQSYMDGAVHPVGGPKALGRAIMDGLERHGVVLRPRQRVLGIAVEDNRATGVRVEDRSTGRHYTVSAACIVSAAGARNTSALLDPEYAAPWNRELAKLPQGIATLLLFLGLSRSPAELGLRGENHWFMPDIDDDAGVARPLGDGVLFVSFSSLNNPAARAHTVEVMHFVDPDVFRPWLGTDEASRPDDYLRLKAEVTERLLQRLDARWPGFKTSVAFAELATPLTFMTYQNSADGVFYGLSNSPERLRSRIARCRTDIKGLYLSGQDAWSAGIEAALWGGILIANAALARPQTRKMWRALRAPAALFDPNLPWKGYMRVARIEAMTPTVRRIRLEPLDGAEVPFRFRAGQYVKLDLPVEGDTIERCYSIASAPQERRFIEIAVRREEHGLGSAFLHRELQAGGVLPQSGPFGDFTVNIARDLGPGRLLLIAGGVGMTPLISVLHAAAGAGHAGPITLLASFRSEAEILFRDEIDACERRLPGLDVSIFLTSPDAAPGYRPGRIDKAALQSYAPDVSRVHLCGPAPFMRAMIAALTELGVPRDAIHTEAFVSSAAARTRSEKAQSIRRAAADAGVAAFRITVRGQGEFPCLPGQTVLAAANAAGLPFEQSCHEGVCGKCRARVLAGPFVIAGEAALSDPEIADGWVLACQTLPRDDLEISVIPAAVRTPGAGAASSRQ